jgi:hypothetical protein
MEATCVHMFLKGDAKRQRDDFVDVALSTWNECMPPAQVTY